MLKFSKKNKSYILKFKDPKTTTIIFGLFTINISQRSQAASHGLTLDSDST